jgi:Tfp pilus assembly protein PilN
VRAVNLIPADQRSGASVGLGRSQGSAYAVLVVVGVLALFGFLYGNARHEISSNRTQVATLDAQAQQAQSEASQLVGYEALNASREKRLKAVEGLIDSRFDWAHVMSEFARVLPAHASIDSLTGTVGSTTGAAAASPSAATGGSSAVAAPVTSATPPGSVPSLTVGGCASSQDEVARTLQRLRLLDGVKEVTLQSSASTSSSGSSAAASAGCGNEGTSFTVAVVFTPLPATSAYPTAKTVADPAIPTDPKPSGRTK